MVLCANLGFPSMGANRELKKALESFWRKESSKDDLLASAKALRHHHWELQHKAGLDLIPCGDFSLYDRMLDTITMVNAVPARYEALKQGDGLDLYFAMARGTQTDSHDVTAMEMTKWFDTNYHYIVPELSKNSSFSYASSKLKDEFLEARAAGFTTRPCVIGPVSFLLLSSMQDGSDAIDLLPALLPVYTALLKDLRHHGVEDIQIEEPCLVMNVSPAVQEAYKTAYQQLATADGPRLMLTTYFGALEHNMATVLTLPVHGIHVDVTRHDADTLDFIKKVPHPMVVSLGLVDGRNVWKTNLQKTLDLATQALEVLGADRLIVASGCSLLHSPHDLDNEKEMDPQVKAWLAFARQKLKEISALKSALRGARDEDFFAQNARDVADRAASEKIHNSAVKARLGQVNDTMKKRQSAFATRLMAQKKSLKLPLLPTTTIGSFPQTSEIRAARARFRRGDMSRKDYDVFLETKTRELITFQEEIGLDVLAHGEYERNDMVEYFGEKLAGVAFSKNGWVQSYGSRCVKPPIIYGDVTRPQSMTVKWSSFAQQLTPKPVKGMLTGPVTILQWSFVRDDQPRAQTCLQIALALRDEVLDLEKAGIQIIQVDEPALREGLPLKKTQWAEYLTWATACFRVVAGGAKDSTQIHTHMCYAEFNDIMHAIADLDADVISIETSRSAMKLLEVFTQFSYPNDIGPGVYDIHSPRVPPVEEIKNLLDAALKVIDEKQIWVNPDCGLKTRDWKEVAPALRNMVHAAKQARQQL